MYEVTIMPCSPQRFIFRKAQHEAIRIGYMASTPNTSSVFSE
jgi:hypothetical protein